MLELAARRCAGQPGVELRSADAVSLPVDDASFDAALCVQVLEYVPDPTVALTEMHRALRPGGRVVVWDVDWATVSLHALDSALTERVLRAWDEHLTHPSLPRTLGSRLRSAGFEEVSMEAHSFSTCELDPETYGAAMLPFVGAFVVGRNGITDEQAQAWVSEQQQLGRPRRVLLREHPALLHGHEAALLRAAARAPPASRYTSPYARRDADPQSGRHVQQASDQPSHRAVRVALARVRCHHPHGPTVGADLPHAGERVPPQR